MLLGFKRQFAPFVEEGSKTHTIRAARKVTPKVGEMCHCYVDPRQKTMQLLGRWPCVRVQDIRIDRARVWVDDVELDLGEKDLLAWRDGFRKPGSTNPVEAAHCFDLMLEFWAKTHGDKVFDGHIIHWNFAKPIQGERGAA